MKNPTSSAALVSLLSTAASPGDASRCRPLPAFAFAATAPTAPSCSLRENCAGDGRRRSSSSSSNSPFARLHPAAVHRGWSPAGDRRKRPPAHNPAVSRSASAAAGSVPKATPVSLSGITGSTSRGQQQQQQHIWGRGGGRGGEQQRGWFARAAGFGRAGPSAGRAGVTAATAATGAPSSIDGPEGIEAEEDRCIRRLDKAVRMVFADYYSCTDTREATMSLGVFLQEAVAALELASHSSDTGAGAAFATGSASDGLPYPARLASRLKARLLESAERLQYHLDGDDPMVLYRFWMRGRAIDVYERDLLHCPRWIELVAETKKQIDNSPVVVESDMGTVCYPNGDIFEGQVDSLIRIAEAGTASPQSTGGFVDAEMASASPAAAAGSQGFDGAGATAAAAVADVRTISGLVSLTIDCLEDGLSDEAAILQRHMKSPDFGHPLLRLASPSNNDPDYPHIPDDPEINPALLRAEQELTEEHIALGERGAKELMHDRRRAQLDVYLVCAAYREYVSPTGLHEEDALILDELLKQAAALGSP